ncbi:mCG145684, partial [Mus musculus]
PNTAWKEVVYVSLLCIMRRNQGQELSKNVPSEPSRNYEKCYVGHANQVLNSESGAWSLESTKNALSVPIHELQR